MPDEKGISYRKVNGLSTRDPQSYSESSAQPVIQTSEVISASQTNETFPKTVQSFSFLQQ